MKKKKSIYKRPSWDEYFLEVAVLVSRRATCLRRRVGAVLVKDKKILATGYNGAPSGLKHCIDIGCLREKLKIPSGQRHELCLASDEEVFTDEGYLPISKVRLGQRVLTHKGIYRKVTKIFKRKFKGKLCYIEPWNLLPVALTPEHPVLAMKTRMCQFDPRTLCKETCKSVNNAYCSKPYLTYSLKWIPACQLNEKDIVLLPFEHRGYSQEALDLSFVIDAPLVYFQALEERSQGKSYADIQSELDIWPSTAYNWVKGGVPRNCIAVCNGDLKHGSSPAKTIPSKINLTKEVLRVIGFYLAEGCSSLNQVSFSFNGIGKYKNENTFLTTENRSGNSPRQGIEVIAKRFSCKKEREFIEEIKATMKDIFGLDCYEDKRRNCHKLVYSSIILAKAFKTLFGENAYKKRLPHFLMRLSPDKQRYILAAYLQGDGYRIDENTATITTASKQLALQTSQILLRLGFIPMVDYNRNSYRLIWKDKVKISYSYLKDNIYFSPIRRLTYKDHSGYVYNLEVEKDNSYVTKSFVVHNCRGLHAEQNVLLQAALHGISTKNSVLYITNQPCIICAKMLINGGIKEIVTAGDYPDKLARDFLEEARIRIRSIKNK